VLDVKPYIPYDVVSLPHNAGNVGRQGEQGEAAAAEALHAYLPMAHAADGTPLQACPLRVPDWIRESDIPLRAVRFTEQALEGLASLECGEVGDGDGLRFCADAMHARELITQVLRQDVRGVKQGRVDSERAAEMYQVRLDAMDIRFSASPEAMLVHTIMPIHS
jgi:hypothetical protein